MTRRVLEILLGGEGTVGGDSYVGIDVHRAARIAAAGHGGQVLISGATRMLVESSLPPDIGLEDLGEHRLKDLSRPGPSASAIGHRSEAPWPPQAPHRAPRNW